MGLINYNTTKLTKIFFKQVKEKEWETSCDSNDICSIISRHHKIFDGNGGDINNIIEKAMIINTRKNFGRESIYTIDLSDFNEAISIILESKKHNIKEPPYGIYT